MIRPIHRLRWLAVAISACCTPTTPPATPTDGDAAITMVTTSRCARACVHLRDLGCPEGASSSCTRACEVRTELVDTSVTCWLDAGTADAARACGGVRCAIP